MTGTAPGPTIGNVRSNEKALLDAFVSAVRQQPAKASFYLQEALSSPAPSPDLQKALEIIASFAEKNELHKLSVPKKGSPVTRDALSDAVAILNPGDRAPSRA